MKKNVYIEIKESPSSGYLSIEDMILEGDIKDHYKNTIENSKKFDMVSKLEIFEGFKLKYILIEVEYDGRKTAIGTEDVFKSLKLHEMVNSRGGGMFGGYYMATDKLKTLLKSQYSERKRLVDDGLYLAV